MKRICFFMGSLSGVGGTERVTTIIANGLSERGYSVSILSLWNGMNPKYPLSDKIMVEQLFLTRKKFKWRYIQIIRKVRSFCRKNKIDILVSVDTYLVFYGIPVSLGTKIKHIAWEHFNYLASLKLQSRNLSRYLAAKFTDVVVVLTTQDIKLWEKHLSIKTMITAIPNPISFEPIKPNLHRWNNKIAIAVGRFNKQKGFDLLIKCWKKVSFQSPDWKLYIIGEGEEDFSLKKQVIKEGMADKIEIVPFKENISDYYLQASIFCLPSRFEGLPMVLLEAQAFALPSVCFDCYTGPSDIITSGGNGFLIDVGDLSAFSKKIVQLCNDENLRIQMGLEALSRTSLFETKNILDQWEKLLQGE